MNKKLVVGAIIFYATLWSGFWLISTMELNWAIFPTVVTIAPLALWGLSLIYDGVCKDKEERLIGHRESWKQRCHELRCEKVDIEAENKELNEIISEREKSLQRWEKLANELDEQNQKLVEALEGIDKQMIKQCKDMPTWIGEMKAIIKQSLSEAEGKEEEMCECNREHRKFGEKETGCCYFCGKNIKAEGKGD